MGKWMRVAFRGIAGASLALLVLALAIGWAAAGWLLHPERRTLQAYQQDWIRHAAAHGMQVESARCVQGTVPCLFVAPDLRAGPRERGRELRSQLEKHVVLRPYGETQGILVLLHGRRGRKEDLLPVAERFVAAGFKCVIPDLPAHGDNPLRTAHFATSSAERGIAEQVLGDARRHFGEAASPAGIWGVSMGGTFAVQALAQSPATWKAAVIVSSLDTLDGVVLDHLSFLPRPLSLLLDQSLDWMARARDGFAVRDVRPGVWAQRVTTPVLVAHGDRDRVIQLDRGKRLFNALHSSDKSWVVVHGASHGNVLASSAALYAGMSAWFIGHMR